MPRKRDRPKLRLNQARVDPTLPHTLAEEQRRRRQLRKALNAHGIRYIEHHPDFTKGTSGEDPPPRPRDQRIISDIVEEPDPNGRSRRGYAIYIAIPGDADPTARRCYRFHYHQRAVTVHAALSAQL